MEYVISFKTTSVAIKAEQCLLEQNLNVRVMPLPPQIRAGCGISLRIMGDELTSARRVLEDNNVCDVQIHSRQRENGKYVYLEYQEGIRRA